MSVTGARGWRLIATYRAKYRALLREERARLGGGADAV
jgi:hypothetical protein